MMGEEMTKRPLPERALVMSHAAVRSRLVLLPGRLGREPPCQIMGPERARVFEGKREDGVKEQRGDD